VTSTEIILAPPRSTTRPQAGSEPVAVRAARVAGQLSRATRNAFMDLRNRPAKARTSRLLVLIAAHNEGSADGSAPLGSTPIERTLASIEAQTRQPDRVVVVADNCDDDTEDRARRFKWVTVMRTVDNADRKVGALTAGWRRWQAGYDFVAGVDADTVLDPKCLQQLETEMLRNKKAGGVMARYTIARAEGAGPVQRALTLVQILDFASWTSDLLRRDRKTYVLGGQATLFRAETLRAVTEHHHQHGPWDPNEDVEDMALTWQMHGLGMDTIVSAQARAWVGSMPTVRALVGQRQKWVEGMVGLLRRHGFSSTTMLPWRQQFGLLLNGAVRVVFLLLLAAALAAGQFRWSWWWITPTVVAMLLNLRTAWRVPGRRFGDLVFAASLIPMELFLWLQIRCTAIAWYHVLLGRKRDGWAAQARAEAGLGGGVGKLVGLVVAVAAGCAAVAYGWTRLDPDWQRLALTYGWSCLAVVTIGQTLGMAWRLVRPTRGFRP
jgi:poly-beta-1,6-N-acetyl-D-glucosamine synthase